MMTTTVTFGTLYYIMVGLFITIGILNTLFCLISGDWLSAILSGIGIFVTIWVYGFVYSVVAIGYSHSVMHGLAAFLGCAIPWAINSLLWGTFTMRAGQAPVWYMFNGFILLTLLCPC